MIGISYLAINALRSQENAVRENLVRIARAAAGLVDGDLHEKLIDRSQMGGQDYRKALEPLVQFHKGLPEIAYLYTLIQRGGKFYFILDTAWASDRLGFNRKMEASTLLEPYQSYSPEEDRAEMRALLKGKAYVSPKPFRDEFGTFLTALAPIKNSSGKTVAVVGLDLDVADYLQRLLRVRLAILVAGVIVTIASTLVGLLVYRIRYRLKIEEHERLAAEAERVAMKEEDHRLVRALGQVVYHYDAQARKIIWRGECESILGWKPSEMPSSLELLRRHIHSDDLGTLNDWKSFPDRDLLIREYRYLHREGYSVWVLDRAVMTRNQDGSLLSVDGVLLDISQRKQFEAELIAARDSAEAAGRAKSEFLAVMSHEIRTPMNGVIGCASLLLETPINVAQKEYLETIRKCGDSLLCLINDILDFSKMESDKLMLERRAFSLRDCIEEVLDLYGLMAAQKRIELIAHFLDNLDWIYSDEVRIRQILVNLVGNALKFTAQGEVVVTISRQKAAPGGESLMLSVRDTGIGISEENQKSIFLPFNQADSSTTRRFGGTGLGLAICHRLASLMGGTIMVQSKLGEGAEFIVVIPVQEALSEKNLPDVSGLQGKKAAIFDDNASFCTAMKRELEAIGMQVIAAGEFTGIKPPSMKSPDVILVDADLPAETLAAIPKFYLTSNENPQPKFIGVTAAGARASSLTKNIPFATTLTRPVRRDELVQGLLEVFSQGSAAMVTRGTVSEANSELLGERYPLKILVVEDNFTNRLVISHMLKHLGYTPRMVENGRLCIELLNKETFDLIFMDIQMPEMDGYEATKILRSIGNNTWITALTADALAEDVNRCRAVGMNDYLSKPIRTINLREAIERCALAKSEQSSSTCVVSGVQ